MLLLHDCAHAEIMTWSLKSGGKVQTVSSLETKENRKQWERIFDQHYIQFVLSTLDKSLAQAIDRVAKDDKQG